MNNENKIKILFINDDPAELAHHKVLLDRYCKESLHVTAFGPNEAESPNVARTLLKKISDSTTEKWKISDFDVIFVDYSMPNMNGMVFLKLFQKTFIDLYTDLTPPPVVLITKYESELLESLDNGIEEGLSGYAFINRDRPYLDIKATALKVFHERQRERWAESFLEISSSLSSKLVDKKSLSSLIKEKFGTKCKELTIFIREFDRATNCLVLVESSDNVPDSIKQDIYSVDVKRFPMLEEALNGNVYWYNSLSDIPENSITREDRTLIEGLDLYRGFTFPLRINNDKPFGTISMYRRKIDPPFTVIEKNYAELMIKQIAESWSQNRHKQQGLAYAQFLKEFGTEENEDILFGKIILHLHKYINNNDDSKTKTTFKILSPGTDKLVCQKNKKHHLGLERDHNFKPSIYDEKSISAWVARENSPRIVFNFKNETDYFSTNSDMISELCLPVASSNKKTEPVIGVINLESAFENYYNESDLEYAEAICRLTGNYIDRLRTSDFLLKVLNALSDAPTRDDLINKSIDIIKAFTGYRLLLFVVRDSEHWKIAQIDADNPYSDIKTIEEDVQKQLNNPAEKTTLLQKALSQREKVFYVPDLGSLPPKHYYEPHGILFQSERLRSQAVFLITAGKEVVGGLSLDFVITNALSSIQLELMKYFSSWLGRLILQDNTYEYLRKKVEDLDQLESFSAFLSKVWHKSHGQLHLLRNLAEDSLERINKEQSPELYNNLDKINVGVEQIKGLPNRFKALTTKPRSHSIEITKIWKRVWEELSAKAKNFNVQMVIKNPFPQISGDEDIIEMVLYHLIDNALDACENQPHRVIELSGYEIPNKRYAICVTDTGKGATNAVIKKMKKFRFSTKPHGTGYGLFYSNQRIKDMGGDIIIKKKDNNVGIEICMIMDKYKE